MEAFGGIREGVTINIQRSDGRVHQAVVTQLHAASSSVSVEWTERNETKGKEIELEALYALNASLMGGGGGGGGSGGGGGGGAAVVKNGRANNGVAASNGVASSNGDNGATIVPSLNGIKRPSNRQTQGNQF
jgi:hypothetical protein